MTDPSPGREPWDTQPEWWRVTLASVADAAVATHAGGRVAFLNPVAESLTGWTQAEAAGVPLASVFKIIDRETRRAVESPTVRAVRDGVAVGWAGGSLLVARDGTERPIDHRASPASGGEAGGAVLVFRDAAGRGGGDQAAQKALAYAADIIATLREPFLVLDGDLRVRTANGAFYQSFRVSAEDTEGRLVYDLGDGQWDIPRLRALLHEVSSDHHPVSDFEVEHDFPAIGRRSMLLNARPFPPKPGKPELVLLAFEDITARRRAEAAVVTSEARYRRLFQTARDGILILDADTLRVIDANPFMTELLGYTHDEFLGKELWQIGLFSDKQASQAAYGELREHAYIRYDHLPLQAKDGRRAEVEFVCNTYRVDARHVAQCNIRDISDRSRLEKKAHEHAEALADLHRRKDEFLAMLSHELRNPLAPIANAVQLLRLQPNEGPLQHTARTIIERQVTQMTRLVDDLMEVSRITTGRVQLRLERVAVNGVVERAVESARPLIDRHRHELAVSPSPEPVWLDADAARLEQVVVNLLTNAAKYTKDGGRVSLSVRQEGDECVLRVRDTGVGIAPELLPRVFDLFTQAERSLDRSQGGLGIGLALVQRLVDLHRGRVEVVSVLGQGSEFVVRLPVVVSPAPLQPNRTEAAPPTGPPLRGLVVDDNVDAAQSLAHLLEACGHAVRTAYTGPTAVAEAGGYDADVVLLDLGLPELDGYEVARRLRRQPTHKGTVLVALTGYGQETDRERSRAAGFDYHLTKPADFGKILEILAKVKAK